MRFRTGLLIGLSVFVYLGIRDQPSTALKVVIMLPLVLIGTAMLHADAQHAQAERRAQTLVEGPTAPDAAQTDASGMPSVRVAAPFVLFLRPFRTDQITADNPRLKTALAWFIPFYRMMLSSTVSIDEVIRAALPPGRELIALSRDDTLGALKIQTTGADWEMRVTELAAAAERILIVPGNRPGTLWEIQHVIAQRLLHKCVFLLVPAPDTQEVPELHLDQVRVVLTARGLEWPDQILSQPIRSGDALEFDDEGRMVRHTPQVVEGGLFWIGITQRRLAPLLNPNTVAGTA